MFASSVFYLTRKDEYHTVKPYALRYIPDDGLPRTTIEVERRSVIARDLRAYRRGADLNRDGFAVMPFQPTLPRDVFCSSATIKSVYLKALATQIKSFAGATHVEILDYAAQRRSDDEVGSPYDSSIAHNAVPVAHIDSTVEEAERKTRYLYGNNADVILSSKWQILTAWKPICGPVKDWPLGLCNPVTVNYDEEAVPCDIVFEDHFTENSQIHHSEHHEWLYVPEQEVNEVLIFKTVDQSFRSGQGPPHAALPLPASSQGNEPRESIDCRVLVSYADVEDFPMIRANSLTSSSHL